MTLIRSNIVHFYKYNQKFLNLSNENKIIYYKNIWKIIKKLNKIKLEISNKEYNILYNSILSNIYIIKY